MTDEPKNQDVRLEALQAALRTRTFLKGVIYYDNRRASIECTIRDLSDTGARIVFSSFVTVPDNIELYIPQASIEALARAISAPKGPHESFMMATMLKLKRTQITVERHAHRFTPFDQWRAERGL